MYKPPFADASPTSASSAGATAHFHQAPWRADPVQHQALCRAALNLGNVMQSKALPGETQVGSGCMISDVFTNILDLSRDTG